MGHAAGSVLAMKKLQRYGTGRHVAKKVSAIGLLLVATLSLSLANGPAGPASAASSASSVSAASTTHYKNSSSSSAPPSSVALNGCHHVSSTSTATAGTGCFKAYGDVVYVYDGAADGYHVEVRIQGSTDNYVCRNYAGSAGGWQACNFDMPENMPILVHTVLFDGSTTINVSWTTMMGDTTNGIARSQSGAVPD